MGGGKGKPDLAILIGKPKGGAEEDDGDSMDESTDPLVAASEDLLSAIRAKDADMVAEALRAAYEACQSYSGGGDGEPEEE